LIYMPGLSALILMVFIIRKRLPFSQVN